MERNRFEDGASEECRYDFFFPRGSTREYKEGGGVGFEYGTKGLEMEAGIKMVPFELT